MEHINIYTAVLIIFLLWVFFSNNEHFGATTCSGQSITAGTCEDECIINYPSKGGQRCSNFTPATDCAAYNNGSCNITNGSGTVLCKDDLEGGDLGKCIPN